MARGGERIEFVGVFAGDADTGEDTPAGFQNTPGQWYTIAQRKRGGTAAAEGGEATLRDSEATQAQTEATTELVTQVADGTTAPPVFVYAPIALGDDDNSSFRQYHQQRQQQPAEVEIDEDETQIVMSLSQDHYGLRAMRAVCQRKIEEEEFVVAKPPPPPPPGLDVIHSASEDDGADSDMSDDMLADDGPRDLISTLAASFQQQDADADESSKKRVPAHVYRPRTQFRHTPTLSVEVDSSSSGAETEVEGEPESDMEAPALSTVAARASASDLMRPTPHLAAARSASDHSGVSEHELDGATMTTTTTLRRRFRLADSSSRLRASERSESTASDSAIVDDDAARPPQQGASVTSEIAEDADAARAEAAVRATRPSDGHSRESSPEPTAAPAASSTTLDAASVTGDSNTRQLKDVQSTPSKPNARSKAASSITDADVDGAGAAHVAGQKRKLAGADTSSASTTVQPMTSEIRIVLTGLEPTPAVRKKIKAVGGAAYEDDIERATHVVAPKSQLKRTVKLLCGISRCDHIVDEKWLDDSARAGAPLSEQDYCLLDTAAQTKWHFDLHKTMYEVAPMQRRQLFAGHTVFITNHKSVLPPVKDLVKIVECAGGHAETKGSASATDLVISTEAALAVASVQKALAAADPQRIYSPELILTSILQQHIDLDAHRLALGPAGGSVSATKKRGRK